MCNENRAVVNSTSDETSNLLRNSCLLGEITLNLLNGDLENVCQGILVPQRCVCCCDTGSVQEHREKLQINLLKNVPFQLNIPGCINTMFFCIFLYGEYFTAQC